MRTTRFNMKDFGTRLRKLRQACGMTQEEFCDKIGISDTHYRKIEAGSRTGSLELIVEMAEYFHVSLDYMLLGEMESNSKAKKDILAVIESLTKIALPRRCCRPSGRCRSSAARQPPSNTSSSASRAA